MKLLVLSTCNGFTTTDGIHTLFPDGQHTTLENSLIKYGYDYEFFLYGFVFGEQYKTIRQWAENYSGDATHALYSDAYDTFAVAPQQEVISKFKAMKCKMLISAEKAYFPDDGNSHLYPDCDTQWHYVNGGGCLFEIEFFKNLTVPYPNPMMDPYWLRDIVLAHPNEVKIDYYCEVFQTLAHSHKEEWDISGDRVKNIATGSNPVFFHYNGIKDKNDIQWLLDVVDRRSK